MNEKDAGVPPSVLNTVLYAVRINTRLADGTGAVPIDPTVAMIAIKTKVAALSWSPTSEVTAKKVRPTIMYAAVPSMFTVLPNGTTNFATTGETFFEPMTHCMLNGMVAAELDVAKAMT